MTASAASNITFTKNKPQEVFYREYNCFDFSKFNNELKLVFSDGNIPSYDKIENLFLEVLNSHATVKKRMLRANFIQLMSKPLRKAIMKRFYKSSRPEVFSKKGVRKSFAKFRAKHLCQNLFFNKVAGLRHITLKKRKKKRLWNRCCPVNFGKFLRTPFLQNSSGGCFWFYLKRRVPLRKT